MNKKIISIILIFVFVFSLVSCNNDTKEVDNKIVCVEYFSYDWVRNIIGEDQGVEVVLLNTSGKDMHSFEPSASDLVEISNAKMVVYLGGISEEWMNTFVENNSVNTYSLMDEFILEFSDVYDLDLDDVDEHFYLSPKVSSVLVSKLGEEISDVFSNTKYLENAQNYSNEISKLTNITMGDKAICVCDRFPFEYLAEDFGFKYYAAFDGCSAETEASFSVIQELVDAIIDNDINEVFVIEKSDANIANTVISSCGKEDIKVTELNSLQSVTDLSTSYVESIENLLNLIKVGTNN